MSERIYLCCEHCLGRSVRGCLDKDDHVFPCEVLGCVASDGTTWLDDR